MSTAECIASIETTRVSRDFVPSLVIRASRATHSRSEFVLVRVSTTSGVSGYGEVSATPYWSGEDASSAEHFIHEILRPVLIGQPLEPIASLSTRMDTVLARNEFTKAGVNTGLWDALGHVRNQPVAQLLGGPFRSSIATKISLSGDGDDLASSFETARAKGFSAFKVKVGFDVEADVARVALTRELVGTDALLGIDANGGWTRTAAHQVMRRLRGCDLGFVEQPVAADDLDGLRSIRGHGVPVVADESVYSAQDLRRVERADACDAVSIYVGKSGSLERAAQSLQLASVLGLDGVIGSNGELGLGCAAQVHVACSVEKLGRLPGDIAGMHYYDGADIVVNPVVIDGAAAHLPTGPGLGVTIDPSIERGFS